MSQPVRAALAILILAVPGPPARTEAREAAPSVPPAPPAAASAGWFEVAVPGGVAALAQAAGLDPSTEPWRLLPDLTRRLYASFGERNGPRVIARVAAALTGGGPGAGAAPPIGTPRGSPAADVADHTTAGGGMVWAGSAPYDAAYPEGPDSETEYAPALSMTVVPSSEPGKLAGDGAEPVTDIVKSPATAVPPLSLITCLITISLAACRVLVNVQV